MLDLQDIGPHSDFSAPLSENTLKHCGLGSYGGYGW